MKPTFASTDLLESLGYGYFEIDLREAASRERSSVVMLVTLPGGMAFERTA